MELNPGGRLAGKRGSADYFTGEVWIEPLAQTPSLEVQMLRVSFAPGARTAWHTHPAGQILYVSSGRGLVQKFGDPVLEMNTGDSVLIAAGEKHWHGARPDCPMQHIAVQPTVGGSSADWMEQVSDAEYAG